MYLKNFILLNKVSYNIIASKDGDIDMFESLKEKIIKLDKDNFKNINRIRSKQQANSKEFNKEWNKWNTKTQIKRKPL